MTLEKRTNCPSNFETGISLSYNGKQVEFFSRNSKEINSFVYQIKKYVVQRNFEEVYVTRELLGAGSYGEVGDLRKVKVLT